MRNRYLDPADLRTLQEKKLRTVVRHACANVPFYGARFRAAGLRADDVQTLADLQGVPTTTKQDVQLAGLQQTMTIGVNPSSCVKRSTSGTTGRPLETFLGHQEKALLELTTLRGLLDVGFRPRDRLVRLGVLIAPVRRLSHRLGLFRTELIPALLPPAELIERLQNSRPDILWSWPTALWTALHHVHYQLRNIVEPRVIITSSEHLDDPLRRRILASSDAELFNFYYSAEFEPIATECPTHEGLHVNADMLIIECLRDDGHPVGADEPGVVIITSLCRFVQPLIRYHLGDRCTLADRPCSCRSSFPLISWLDGRHQNMVQLPSGTLRSPAGFAVTLRDFPGIEQFRVTQESIDHFVLRLVPIGSMSEATFTEMRERLREYLGEPVRLDIALVESIQTNRPGFKKFQCRLPKPEL